MNAKTMALIAAALAAPAALAVFPPVAKTPVAKTPGEGAPSAAGSAADQQRLAASGAIRVLLAHLKDPDSLRVERIYSRRPPREVCISYRAKNGFGAADRALAVVFLGAVSDRISDWNAHCAGDGFYDVDPLGL